MTEGHSSGNGSPVTTTPVEAAASIEEQADETKEAQPKTAAPEDDEAEQVEPELVETAETQGAKDISPSVRPHHHPPPPPSLRKREDKDGHGPGPRFELASTPRLARDLMSRKLFTVEPDTTLENLEQHMERFRFGHLPVVDGEKLVGLVSHGDLLHVSSSFLSDQAQARNAIIHKLPVERIMQRELITVKPDDPLADVATLMWEARVGCVLVVEGEDKLVGIITEGDFLRVAHHFLTRSS